MATGVWLSFLTRALLQWSSIFLIFEDEIKQMYSRGGCNNSITRSLQNISFKVLSLGLKMCVPVWEGKKTLLQCFKHNFRVDTTSKKKYKMVKKKKKLTEKLS